MANDKIEDGEIKDLPTAARTIEALRAGLLLGETGEALAPQAEQFYLLALNALESAQRYMKLADYHNMRKW